MLFRYRLHENLRTNCRRFFAEVFSEHLGEFGCRVKSRQNLIHQQPEIRVAALHRDAIGLVSEQSAGNNIPERSFPSSPMRRARSAK